MPGGHGNRYMYYLTGLPGWMRFGFSPGWLGRSPTGLGPAASYLMTGQWPTPQTPGTTPGIAPFAPGAGPEQELSFLKNQAGALKSQIDQINSRIKELEKMEK